MSQDDFFSASCTGSLTTADLVVSVTFELICSREGDIRLDMADLPITPDTARLRAYCNDRSSDAPHALQLDARDTEGRVVSSSAIYATCSFHMDATGDRVTLVAEAFWLQVSEPDFNPNASAAGVRGAYYAIGLRGSRTHQVETRAGRLKVLANSSVANFDEITGRLDIEAPASADSITEWVESADEVASDVLDIISLADGHLIRWSVRQLIREKKVLAMEFRGPSQTGQPRRGLYPWFDLQPILELAAHNYTPELKARTGVDVALEWSLMNPQYEELEFLACVTAIEHLATVYQRRNNKASPPGRAYFDARIEPALTATLNELRANATQDDALAAIDKSLRKLRELTRATLQDSVERMLEGYKVPLAGLEGVLRDLIDLRNSIVHKGVAPKHDRPVLRGHVDTVRELLKRVFLTLLGYSGRYYSYLAGRKFVPFPPTTGGNNAAGAG